MAGGARLGVEDVATAEGGGGEGAAGFAGGAARRRGGNQRGDVGGEGVELGAEAGLAGGGRGVEVCELSGRKREESGAAEGTADVVLEILDFVEIGGPVNVAVSQARATAKIGGAA
jgi:hypothetical protein